MTVAIHCTKKHLPLLLLVLQPAFALSALAQAPAPAPAAPSGMPAAPPDASASPMPPAPDASGSPAPIVPGAVTPPPIAPSPDAGTDKPKRRGFRVPKIGVDFDSFMPSSGKTRSRFGSSWGGIGFGIGRPSRPSGTGRVSFDFSTLYKKSGDHHAFAAPVGISYRRAFNANALTNGSPLIPYYGVSLNLVGVDLRSPEDNVHSGFRFTEGGSLLVGTTVGKSGFVEGKYAAVGKVKGFDLSGFKLTAGIRF